MTAAMGNSEPGLPAGIGARALCAADLDAARGLSQEAGWNQVAADWRVFLELGSAIALTRDGRLIATAATLPYAGRFAWISMVLVTAPERRQGLARWLLRRCVNDLLAKKLVPVLDATPAGRTVYIGLGFQDRWGLRRLIGHATVAPDVVAEPGAATVHELAPADWPQVIAYDTAIFGADRGGLLLRLAERLPAAALVAKRNGRLAGFLLGRDGRVMNQLGPLVAEDVAVASAILTHALRLTPAPVAIDVPDRHAALGHWLADLGFSAERPLTRMVRGDDAAFDDGARLFAIAGPELG
jgi:GNAT superfamily N-acetyltransferase